MRESLYGRLIYVPLLGVGTPDVESFPSYIARVAYWHGVVPAQLLQTLRLDVGGEYNGVTLPMYRSGTYLRSLSAPVDNTLAWIDIFGEVMGEDLSPCTLHGLTSAAGKFRIARHAEFHWCPECLGDMREQGQEIYFKLLWTLRDVRFCPLHRTPLQGSCEGCGAKQLLDGKFDKNGLCGACGAPLYLRDFQLTSEDICSSWENEAFDWIRFVEDCAHTVAGDFPEDGFENSLLQIYDCHEAADMLEELWAFITEEKYFNWLNGVYGASATSVRRLCFRFGISMYDLLMGEFKSTPEVLDTAMFCKIPPGGLAPKKKITRNHRRVLQRIANYRKSCSEPPSLKDVAIFAGVSDGYLRYRHSALTRAIVDEYLQHQNRVRAKRLWRAQFCAMEYFRDRVSKGEFPSRKSAYKELRAQTMLAKFPLKRAIQKAWEFYVADPLTVEQSSGS